MRNVNLNLPTLIATVATRAAIGFGIGLLVGNRLPAARRNQLAAMLIGIGAVSTVPLARQVWKGSRRAEPPARSSSMPSWS
ncbi:MAG TPA: hypothetical protein VFV98_01205 [Vicinamibacterales bacterium]|nr:hypothetical protein [Vicinamibacterales bacterium]